MKTNLIITFLVLAVTGAFNAFGQTWHIGGDNVSPAVGALGSINNKNISFITNNTERMRLTRDGFFGIGTTTPNTRLHVANGGVITLSSGGNIVSGLTSGQNIVIGTGQITARNNGAPSTLFLNVTGG